MKLQERQRMSDKHDSWNGEIYLRYDRNERLKRAPESVRRMYEPDYIKRLGIIKGLMSTRTTRSLLFSIIAVFALTFLSFLLKPDRQTGKINGIPVKLEWLSQKDLLYVNIVFDATAQSEIDTLPVTVSVNALNSETKQQENKIVDAIYLGNTLSIPIQFSAQTFTQLEAIIRIDKKTLTLHSTLKK